jgi:hypothetical protein
MQAKRQTCSVALYNEETNTLSTFHIPVDDIADTLSKHASFDVPLADFDNRIDDDFARRLGGMTLLTLASRSPVLKENLAITTPTDAASGAEDSGAASEPSPQAKRSWWGRK